MKKENKEKKFMKPGRTNEEDRLNFVKFWAEYMKTHSDTEWSAQQNILINSIIKKTMRHHILKNVVCKGARFLDLKVEKL